MSDKKKSTPTQDKKTKPGLRERIAAMKAGAEKTPPTQTPDRDTDMDNLRKRIAEMRRSGEPRPEPTEEEKRERAQIRLDIMAAANNLRIVLMSTIQPDGDSPEMDAYIERRVRNAFPEAFTTPKP